MMGKPRGGLSGRSNGRGGGTAKRGRGGGKAHSWSALNPRRVRRAEAVVYDPAAHTEFVTGFRRRKQARRMEAQHKAAVAEKESLRTARREKREFLRGAAQRARAGPDDAEPDESAADGKQDETEGAGVQEYAVGDGEAVISTVVTKMDSGADTTFIKSKIGDGANIRKQISRKNPLPKDISSTKKLSSGVTTAIRKKKSSKGKRPRVPKRMNSGNQA